MVVQLFVYYSGGMPWEGYIRSHLCCISFTRVDETQILAQDDPSAACQRHVQYLKVGKQRYHYVAICI